MSELEVLKVLEVEEVLPPRYGSASQPAWNMISTE